MRDLLRSTYYIIAVYRGTDPHGRYRSTMTLEGTRFADLDTIARVLGLSSFIDDTDGRPASRFTSVEVCGYKTDEAVPVTLRRYRCGVGERVEWEHPHLHDMVQGETFA